MSLMFTYCNTRTGVTFLSACECSGKDIVLIPPHNDADPAGKNGGKGGKKDGKRGGGKNGKNASAPEIPELGADENEDLSGADDTSTDGDQSGDVSDSDTSPESAK